MLPFFFNNGRRVEERSPLFSHRFQAVSHETLALRIIEDKSRSLKQLDGFSLFSLLMSSCDINRIALGTG